MDGAASSGAERHWRALESLYASAPVNSKFESSLEVTGEVTDLYERKGRPNVLLEMTARDEDGEVAGIVRITAIWPT